MTTQQQSPPKDSPIDAALKALTEQFGYTKLYHPRGALVSLPVPADPALAFEHVNKCLDVGWLVIAPGLEEGEAREQIGYLLRAVQERDGEVTPMLLLYDANEAHSFSFLKVYLNRGEDVEAFERAAGIKLDSLPEYAGADKPERGKSARVDQFIIKMQKSFGVVMKNNPRYNEADRETAVKRGDIYKVPRRLFVRWDDPHAKPHEEQPPQQQDKPPAAAPPAGQPNRMQAWTIDQAIAECAKWGVTKEELRAEIKKRNPQSTGWNMLRDTVIAQFLIQQRRQPLAPPPGTDPNDIPF
jgi:hypothetical protein